jgi:hypothetical protein
MSIDTNPNAPAGATQEDKRVVNLQEENDGSVLVSGLAEPAGAPAPTPTLAPAPAAQQDAAPGATSDEEESDEPPLQAGEDPNDPVVQKRIRRREERRNKRDRTNQRFDEMQAQILARDQLINDMRDQLAASQRRSTHSDIAAIDARLKQEKDNVTYLTQVISDGTKTQNGEAVAQATLALTNAQRVIEQLDRIKKTAERAAATPAAPQLDPRMAVLGAQWMKRNPWYNPRNPDADTQFVLALDQQLSAQGIDPTTPTYWDELSRRVAHHLPHRASGQSPAPPADPGYNAGASQRKPDNRSVVAGSGQDGLSAPNGSAATAGTFRLSPERVQALKDAGMWSDEKVRAQAIQRFRDHDRQAAAERR